MGVHGLWSLLQPTGKSVTLESLEGKILAVDVSVWLHQSLKGMRDEQGNPVHNAHLHVLFKRVCKLLFYRIRPVFVFDGGVPPLKRETLARRRQKRVEASVNSDQATQKLVNNLLKHHALKAVLGEKAAGQPSSTSKNAKEDIFALNPIADADKPEENYTDEWEERMAQRHMIYEEFEDLSAIDVYGEDFKTMPDEIQHEILAELKDRNKKNSWAKIDTLPEESSDFSKYQMEKLMKSNKLTQKIEDVRKQLNSRSAGTISEEYVRNKLTGEIEARRVVSDDTTHYILIKGLKELAEKRRQRKSRESVEDDDSAKLKRHSSTEGGDSQTDVKPDIKELEESQALHHQKQQALSASLDSNDIIARCKQIMKNKNNEIRQTAANKRKAEQVADSDGNESMNIVQTQPADMEPERNSVSSGASSTFVRATRPIATSTIENEGTNLRTTTVNLAASSSNIRATRVSNTQLESDKDKSNSNTSGAASTFIRATRPRKNPVIIVEEPPTKKFKDNQEAEFMELLGNSMNESDKSASSMKDKSSVSKINTSDLLVNKNNAEELVNKNAPEVSIDRRYGFNRFDVDSSHEDSDVIDLSLEIKDEYEDPKQQMPKDVTTDAPEKYGSTEQTLQKAIPDVSKQVEDASSRGNQMPDLLKDLGTGPLSNNLSDNESLSGVTNDVCTNDVTENVSINDVTEDIDSIDDVTNEIDYLDDVKTDMEFESAGGFVSEESSGIEKNVEKKPLVARAKPSTKVPISKIEKAPPMPVVIESESSDEGNDFIEVQVNPENITRDDKLFPASIFTTKALPESQEPSQRKSHSVVDHKSEPKVIDALQAESESDLQEPFVEPQSKESHAAEPAIDQEWVRDVTEALDREELTDIQMALESEGLSLAQEKGKQERLTASITDQIQAEAQELLGLLGVPYVIATTEAEAQCAYLDMTSQIQGTITEDSDIWLFGGQHVYKNFFNQNKCVEHFNATDIKYHLMLDRDAFIRLAYLCGSDYTDGIQGVGPVTGLEMLTEFPGHELDGLTKLKEWWKAAKDQIHTVPGETKIKKKIRSVEIREGFPNPAVYDAYMKPDVDESRDKFTWGTPDLDLLRDYAQDKMAWSKAKVDETLLPVLKKLNETQSQSHITSFFSVHAIDEPRRLKSSRVKQVVKRMRDTQLHTSPNKKGKVTPGQKVKGKPRSKKVVANEPQGCGYVSTYKAQDVALSEESSSESEPEIQSKPSTTQTKPTNKLTTNKQSGKKLLEKGMQKAENRDTDKTETIKTQEKLPRGKAIVSQAAKIKRGKAKPQIKLTDAQLEEIEKRKRNR